MKKYIHRLTVTLCHKFKIIKVSAKISGLYTGVKKFLSEGTFQIVMTAWVFNDEPCIIVQQRNTKLMSITILTYRIKKMDK